MSALLPFTNLSLGYMPRTYSRIDMALDTAAKRVALAFVQPKALTLSKVSIYGSGVVGSPLAADAEAELMTSHPTTGKPDTVLETISASDANPAAGVRTAFSGFTTALTAGVRYYLVFKNQNASPATDNWWVSTMHTASIQKEQGGLAESQGFCAWDVLQSTDSGVSYTYTVSNAAGMRLEFATGEFIGYPWNDVIQNGTLAVYGTRELGSDFTNVYGRRLRLLGVVMSVIRTGTPTVDLFYKLRRKSDLALLGSTYERHVPVASGIEELLAYFPSPIILEPSEVYRVTMAEPANSDAAGNNYQSYFPTWNTDADTKLLLPFQGEWERAYFDGSSWATTAGAGISMSLLVDPFLAPPQALDNDGVVWGRGKQTGAISMQL